jgi:hypothetical protein
MENLESKEIVSKFHDQLTGDRNANNIGNNTHK